jgi:DNA invertase Pin-like site-specific DNA recombinase
MKAAIYTRVSTSQQEDGTSPDVQHLRCQDEIVRRGWTLVGHYYDGGVSGSRSSRPQLDQLRAASLAGEVDVIVANTLDRFTRDEEQWFEFTKNVPVRIVTLDGVDTGTDDRLLSGIRVLIAADERRKIYRRTMSGRLARVEEGHWVGGDPPFGHAVIDAYEADSRRRVPRKLIVNEEEAVVVRRAAQVLIDELHSTAKTAEILNAEGLLPRPNRLNRSPKRWNSYTLRKILKRRSLMGEYTWAKRGTSEPVTFDIPQVLDQGRWLELQAVLKKSERRPYAATNIYPLSGRVISPCGERYVGFTSHETTGRLMRCTGKKHAPRCSCRQQRAAELESRVWEAVYDLLTDEERLVALAPGGADAARNAAAAGKELARIDAQIAAKEKAVTQHAADALVAGLAPDMIRNAVAQIDGDLLVLREQRAEMASWHIDTVESEARKERLRYFVKLAQVLMNPPPEIMHEVFRLLDVEVELLENAREPKITVRGNLTSEAIDRIGRSARDLSVSPSTRGTAPSPASPAARTPSPRGRSARR